MTPEQLAKSGTEHSEQVALFAWCNMAALFGVEAANDEKSFTVQNYAKENYNKVYALLPELKLLFAIHNQGHGDRIRGSRAKAEGVKAGVPDLMLPVAVYPYNGLFIELKKQTKGKVSDAQKEWLARLEKQGYKVEVCFGYKEAIATLLKYLGV